jgi:hypothetical protein
MTFRIFLVVTVLSASLGGCAESTVIRTYPTGAKVSVNDLVVGVSPVVYTIKHSEIGEPHRVRAEFRGLPPREGELRTRICPGRIVGGIFTLGITLLFRGPTCFVSPQDFALEDGGATTAESSTLSPGANSVREPSVEDRLARVEQLYQAGKITREERDKSREEILRSGR